MISLHTKSKMDLKVDFSRIKPWKIRLIIFLGIISVSSVSVIAQQGKIEGIVQLEDQENLSDIPVILYNDATNKIIKTTITEEDGSFFIDAVESGRYFVQVSFLGYDLYNTPPFEVQNNHIKLDTIVMKPGSIELDEVKVTGQAPIIQSKNGKIILNVENSALTEGSNALEILQRTPGVSLGKDRDLMLMGQSGVRITIDGKRTHLSKEQLITFLESMSSSEIKSVEVSTNRSAKDDAEGSIGTINIVLKKNRIEGFNGSISASAGHGIHPRGNSSFQLNYKKEKTTLFGDFSYILNKWEYDNIGARIFPAPDAILQFDQRMIYQRAVPSQNFKAGIEQKTSDKNTMLFQVSGKFSNSDEDNKGVTKMGPGSQSIDSILNTDASLSTPFRSYTFNFNNRFVLDTLNSDLTLDADWSTFRSRTNTLNHYHTTQSNGEPLYTSEEERSFMPSDIDILITSLDWKKNMMKNSFRTGVKYSHVKSDNNFHFEHKIDGSWRDYTERINHFIYTEQIAAAYFDYNHSFNHLQLTLGLRGEHTRSDGHSITLDERVVRNYFNIFPSGQISMPLNETGDMLSLNYSRKITRPNYHFLNPFEYYLDKFMYRKGNPYLQPHYTHGIKLNYILKSRYIFTLGADFTRNSIFQSLDQNSSTGVSWITMDNMGKEMNNYLNINAPFEIGNLWNINNNLTFVYSHYKGEINGQELDKGRPFFQGTSMSQFSITPALQAELTINYYSKLRYHLFVIKGMGKVDIGMSYKFSDERSTLRIAATDIFDTMTSHVTSQFGEINTWMDQHLDMQAIRLSFSYKFGNLSQKAPKRSTTSEEKQRAIQTD